MKNKFIILFIVFSIFSISAQNYRSPLDIPLVLSANCGELRANHFHSGIDIKTQGVIGKPVFSIEDGYISRISVSPSGYGLALYVTHPSTGHTSVYGHLDRFAPKVATYVKEMQYKQEAFNLNVQLNASQFPVKKGDLIAYSGNTGSSGGPHVHFEIRDTKTEYVLDPLAYFGKMIIDTRAPDVRGIAVYPVPGRGIVNGNNGPLRQSISSLKDGGYADLKQPIEAWGIIGLGIKSYDRMDNTSNIYGVRIVRLFVDDKKIFESDTKEFSFDQTRMINTFIDYVDWRQRKSFFMQSFIEPGNKLPFYSSINNGYINIDQERIYNLKYELQDIYGNKTNYDFIINGKKQTIPIPSGCSLVMTTDHDNRFIRDDFKLIIPKGNLYNDVCFVFDQQQLPDYYSPIFTVNKQPVPLDRSAEVELKLSSDLLKNKRQYGIVQIKEGKNNWIGGTYTNGYIKANIKELGIDIAVFADMDAPVIIPVASNKWIQQGIIKLKVTDSLSGIASFRGTIDNKYALFEHDVKSNVYTYKLDDSRIKKGESHKLVFIAIDAAGNKTEYSADFDY